MIVQKIWIHPTLSPPLNMTWHSCAHFLSTRPVDSRLGLHHRIHFLPENVPSYYHRCANCLLLYFVWACLILFIYLCSLCNWLLSLQVNKEQLNWNINCICKIWGFHSDGHEECRLLGCGAV
jgi:hypothetical protein